MLRIRQTLAASFLLSAGLVHAQQLTAMIAVEPTSKKDSLAVVTAIVESALSKATGKVAKVYINEDLTDVMRATRTGEVDIYIAPPQVAASALTRGYGYIGSTNPMEQYVLVTRRDSSTVSALGGRRLYLPQQDSVYSYVARGMLNAAGLSFQNLQVEFARWPSAGLVAVDLGVFDATVVRQTEWDDWVKSRGRALHAVSTSIPVPGGLSVVVRKTLPEKSREKLARWFATNATSSGLKPVTERADLSMYKAVAELRLLHAQQPARRRGRYRGRRAQARRRGRGDRRHPLGEGIQGQAHPAGGVRAVPREEPEGCGVRLRERRLPRPRQARQGEADYLLVQRRRVLEVVQGLQGRGCCRLQEGLLVPRWPAGMGRYRPAGRAELIWHAGAGPARWQTSPVLHRRTLLAVSSSHASEGRHS
ncbi:phosphate/phosphite/phosphonate ABC transporter substrate-binding protein [Rhizobacter sp. J219]|nr:phosphate/phosphite/phosphonate ABC transporter substrate-binding protein [Rhizobacter sp. J219]MCR5882604.1 phosphate/phosphite/phosphonate ABC transporter substrate-binding protein [Rhizobacter sp. J219]